MEHYKRHRFLWNFLRPFFRFILWLKFNFHPRLSELPAPCLIVANHCTDWDPFLLGVTVKKHVYYIASDHVFRKKLVGTLIHWAQAPITRLKGSTAGDTALTAIRRLRAGHNVCVFAEGNRSFNGRTGDIVESTAKLAKSAGRIAGASLVTFKFTGGYLSSPRWAGSSCHRGFMSGGIVRVYMPDELQAMPPSRIADVIRADIYENAWVTQREKMIPYKGRRRAQYLERALCICPKCNAMGALESRDNDFFCTACGMRTAVNEYGFFEGGDLPFDNVLDWDEWQAVALQKRVDEAGDDPIAADSDTELAQVLDDYKVRPVGTGFIRIFRDRLECCGLTFPFSDISAVGLPGPQGLEFGLHDGRHYCVTSEKVRNMRKYLTIYRAITAPETILAV